MRDQLPVDDEPVAILGGSLGGAVALQVLTAGRTPIRAVALVNPAVRIRTAVALAEYQLGQPYRWTAGSRATADEPGLEPAPQLPATRAVDEILTRWFLRQSGKDG